MSAQYLSVHQFWEKYRHLRPIYIFLKIAVQDGGCRHLEYFQMWVIGTQVAPEWPVSISKPNLTMISSSTTEIWPKIGNPRWRLPPSWILPKVRYWSTSSPWVANIYQHTQFDENIFICDRDMAKNRKFKMAVATILNFTKSGMLGYCNPWVPNIYQCTNFEENIAIYDRYIFFKNRNRRWRLPPSWIFPNVGYWDASSPWVAGVYQRTQFDNNIFIYDRDMAKNRKSKMADAAILNFAKSGILGHK